MDVRNSPGSPTLFKSKLCFSTGLTMDEAHVKISFSGPEELVKQRTREIIYGLYSIGMPYQKVEPSSFMTHHKGAQYNFLINQGDEKTLTTMFWYIGKVTGHFYDPQKLFNDYVHNHIDVRTDSPEGSKIERAAFSLSRAAQAALDKKDEPLVLKDIKPNDRDLWTAEELQELEDMIKNSSRSKCRIL